MRAQDDIAKRLAGISPATDPLGFARETLLPLLDFEHARPYLKDGTTEEDWGHVPTEDEIAEEARQYLEFAIGKIQDHRGISASRSVQKLTEYAWVLGRNDIVLAMEANEYAQYGAPKIRAFAAGMSWAWPTDEEDPGLARMVQGLPCEPGCESGCGR